MVKATQQPISSSEKTKVFSGPAIIAGGIVFGLPAFIYFVYKNLKNLGQPGLAKKATIWITIGYFLSLALPTLLILFTNITIPLISTYFINVVAIGLLYITLLKIPMERHHEGGGRYYGLLPMVTVMIMSTIIVSALLLSWVYVISRFGYEEKRSYSESLELAGAMYRGFDAELYDKRVIEFRDNEDKALKVLDARETASAEEWIAGLNHGITLWNKNLEVLDQIESMKELPPSTKPIVQKLDEYTKLSIEEYNLRIKAEQEQSTAYNAKIDEINNEIEQMLNEMKKNDH